VGLPNKIHEFLGCVSGCLNCAFCRTGPQHLTVKTRPKHSNVENFVVML